MPTTGQMIKAMRMNRQYAAAVGADACMISKRCYYDIERGISLPNEAKLQALANRYRCDIDDLKGQDWIPDADRNRKTEAERKEAIFGASSYREVVEKNVEEKKTILNGEDVTEQPENGGDVIKQLRERVKYLDGIIADKDEQIRTLRAQLDFSEPDVDTQEALAAKDRQITQLAGKIAAQNTEIQHWEMMADAAKEEMDTIKAENARLKDALVKLMLKQIEED